MGEAADGASALKLAYALKPDVVLMDLLMPVMDGVTATEAIRKELPDTEVLALTSVLESGLVIQAISSRTRVRISGSQSTSCNWAAKLFRIGNPPSPSRESPAPLHGLGQFPVPPIGRPFLLTLEHSLSFIVGSPDTASSCLSS